MAFKPERSLKVVLTSLFSQYRNENGVSATRVQAVRFSVVYPPEVAATLFASASAVTGYGLDGAELDTDALVLATPAI